MSGRYMLHAVRFVLAKHCHSSSLSPLTLSHSHTPTLTTNSHSHTLHSAFGTQLNQAAAMTSNSSLLSGVSFSSDFSRLQENGDAKLYYLALYTMGFLWTATFLQVPVKWKSEVKE